MLHASKSLRNGWHSSVPMDAEAEDPARAPTDGQPCEQLKMCLTRRREARLFRRRENQRLPVRGSGSIPARLRRRLLSGANGPSYHKHVPIAARQYAVVMQQTASQTESRSGPVLRRSNPFNALVASPCVTVHSTIRSFICEFPTWHSLLPTFVGTASGQQRRRPQLRVEEH